MPDTILLTGISGFIAKHIALKLLNTGYAVRGTVRRMDRRAEVFDALRPHLIAGAEARLHLVPVDLTRDDGWVDAMDGVSALMHVASPFPIAQPENPDDLIRPAVDGTLRALRAAQTAGVDRVILTSSTIAVINSGKSGVQDESDWCDANAPGTTAYALSKLRAERAAWAFVQDHPTMRLTSINPGLVLGPPLDKHSGSSISIVTRLLRGRDPAVPRLGFPVVDVRDVAEMHLRALQRPATAGKRYLAVAGSMWMGDMAQTLKAVYPQRKIATRDAPKWLLRVLALFDKDVASILPSVGQMHPVSNARAMADMDMTFIPPEQALRDAADWLVTHGHA
jgi:dihydroflavonol-4-reductase